MLPRRFRLVDALTNSQESGAPITPIPGPDLLHWSRSHAESYSDRATDDGLLAVRGHPDKNRGQPLARARSGTVIILNGLAGSVLCVSRSPDRKDTKQRNQKTGDETPHPETPLPMLLSGWVRSI